MKCVVAIVLVAMMVVVGTQARGPFRKMFPDHGNLNLPSDQQGDAGEPLFLTPLLEAGKIQV